MNGLTSFVPEASVDNPFEPPIAVTRVAVSSRDGETTFTPDGRTPLELSHRQSSLALDYAALSFTNAARNRYAYRLEGFDDGWIDNGLPADAAGQVGKFPPSVDAIGYTAYDGARERWWISDSTSTRPCLRRAPRRFVSPVGR